MPTRGGPLQKVIQKNQFTVFFEYCRGLEKIIVCLFAFYLI